MEHLRRHYWQDYTATEIAALVDDATLAILPLAAIEQHGAHLPLSTDLDINQGLLDAALTRLGANTSVFVLPPMMVGMSLEHTRFAGTLSLPPETAIDTIVSHGRALAAAGIKRLMLFNSHGGNKAVMDIAALKLREAYGLLVVKATYTRFALPAEALPMEELRHGLHGGALETALMLYLAPNKVRTEAIFDAPSLAHRLIAQGSTLGPEGEAGFAWMADDLHPAGVTGNACLADAEMGARLVEHYAERLAKLIEDAQSFALDALANNGSEVLSHKAADR
ncbi:creatininase family protein [Phytohalomonas tamaricis]|uniref:creatininase family protein n=1 Tax=Phytohalomonas tamaricis TaxID=2081032 RepID=UPI000D0B0A88|nr:creatininase family protein [Phytohalomonas tamaricis]